MSAKEIDLKLSAVVFREDLYPRIEKNPALVQRYAEDLDVLPPIEVNQNNELIDGWHRWTAHKKAEVATIKAVVTKTASDMELLSLAIRRNATHGLQLADKDKRTMAVRLFHSGEGLTKEQIAETLSVSLRMVTSYLSDVEAELRKRRKEKIFDMWMACYSLEEIGEAVGVTAKTVDNEIRECVNLETLPKLQKVSSSFQDADFETPIYNIWTFSKKSNAVSHFGNSEARIVENLLYLYTEPFDIVVDPFAGGGSTIDVCKKRLRRYWASDRKPIPERAADIRQLDVCDALPPLHKRWSEVALTYLDPPYWRQAAGKYSKDKTDLANMPLDEFTAKLSEVISKIGKKQSKGAIALLMQPTQWNADNREFTDHVTDVLKAVKGERMILENRVQCPYSTEQCTPQMVEWAKKHRKLLVLSRELVIWRMSK